MTDQPEAVVSVYVSADEWGRRQLEHVGVEIARRVALRDLAELLGREPAEARETIGIVAGHLHTGRPGPGRFVGAPWPEATVVRVRVRLVEESP
jgi:hypothetical protein